MNTDNITNGRGVAQEMNTVADQKAEETKKEFKKTVKNQTGYKPPKYAPEKFNRPDETGTGETHAVKINKGHGYVKDFDAWVDAKIKETRKDNE